jgi:membrane-anchored protein YejM (alkaline phosphatase superfamily)
MINNPPLVSRKTLLRWCGWFFLGNIFLFWLIGLHYLPAAYPRKIPYEFSMLSTYGKSLRTLFVTLSFWGHLGLIAFAPSLLVATCIFLLPNKKFIFSIAILIASIAACLFVFDTVAFNLYRFHLNGIMLALIANGLYEQILGFSSLEYLTIGVVIIGIFTI